MWGTIGPLAKRHLKWRFASGPIVNMYAGRVVLNVQFRPNMHAYS